VRLTECRSNRSDSPAVQARECRTLSRERCGSDSLSLFAGAAVELRGQKVRPDLARERKLIRWHLALSDSLCVR